MPQGDLNDVKVSCENLAPTINDNDNDNDNDDSSDDALANPVVVMIPPPDYAPESFWLSKDAELDWLDRNAFLERKDSGKGSQGVTSYSNPNLVISSQRYSANLKSKASLIALPKPQKQNYAEVKNRRHCSRPSSARLFPKRSEPDCPKPVLALTEPGSPKVSCMGRVRSRKDRKNRKKDKKASLVRVKSVKERKPGFWKNFRSIFRGKGGASSNTKLDSNEDRNGDDDIVAVMRKKSSRSSSRKKRGFDSNNNCNNNDDTNNCTGSSEPPGLGGMKRFASGRKSDGWAGDVEFDGARSEPLNPRSGGPIWRRRDVGPPVEVEVDRDWRSVGPVSV